jgi:MFS family permease
MGFGGGSMMGRGGAMGGDSARPSLRAAFVSLKIRDFRLLFASMLASNMAMGMQMLARGWLAFDLTGSFAIMGVISFSFAIPMFLFSLIGGATADRVEKRTLMVLTQFGTLITALATGIMITTGVISVPLLFAVGIVQGTVMAFRMPVQMSMLAEVVPEDDLMSAMAINNAAMSGTRLLAPLTAGLMLAVSGVDMVYYAQVVMYVITLVFVLQLPRTTGHLVGADERGTVLFEAIGGLRYVWGDKQILMLLIMGSIPMMLMMPPMMTMLPGFAVTELGLGGDGLSYLMTLSGIGSLIGSFAVATLTEFKRKPLLQMISGLGAGLGLVALGLGTKAFGLPGALAALLLVGLFQGPFMTLNMTMVMSKSKPEYLGRVMSVFMLLFGLMPFMSYPMGVLADIISASSTFAVAGVVLIVFMTLMFLINPRYTFSRFEPRVGVGGGSPMRRPGATRPAMANAATSAAPSNGAMSEPAPAMATNGTGAVAPAEVSTEAVAPAGESDDAVAPRSRPAAPREYMTASSAAMTIRDYMVDQATGAAAKGAITNAASNGAPSSGASTNGAANGASNGGTSYGLPLLESETADAETDAAEPSTYGLPAPQSQPASGNCAESPPIEATANDYGLGHDPSADGNGSAPPSIEEMADDYGLERDAEVSGDGATSQSNGEASSNGSGSSNGSEAAAERPPERVELPPRRRAGPVERTTIAAITATVVASVLSSVIFRRK